MRIIIFVSLQKKERGWTLKSPSALTMFLTEKYFFIFSAPHCRLFLL